VNFIHVLMPAKHVYVETVHMKTYSNTGHKSYTDCRVCVHTHTHTYMDIYIRKVCLPYASTLNNKSFAKFRWGEMKWKLWRALAFKPIRASARPHKGGRK